MITKFVTIQVDTDNHDAATDAVYQILNHARRQGGEIHNFDFVHVGGDETVKAARNNSAWLLTEHDEAKIDSGQQLDVAYELAELFQQIDAAMSLGFLPAEWPRDPKTDEDRIALARTLIARARALLKAAGCVKSAQRARLLLSSVKGALGNAQLRRSAEASGRARKRVRRAPKVEVSNIK